MKDSLITLAVFLFMCTPQLILFFYMIKLIMDLKKDKKMFTKQEKELIKK